MGRRTILVALLLLAVAATLPLALRNDDAKGTTQVDLVVRDSARAAARAAGVDLEAAVRGAAERAVARLPERSPVRIEVKVDPAAAIPETGVGGQYDAGGIRIAVERPLRPGSEAWLRRAVAHELHHAIRLERRRVRSTLLQALVTEGLADHFAREVFPNAPASPWTSALTAAEERELWDRAQAQGDRPYDHAAWFYGGDSFPRWAGYRLGYRIVGEYLQRTGRTAADAVADHPDSIVAAYEARP